MKGTIKRLVSDRGFGFIAPDGAKKGKDVFFHHSGLVEGGTKFDDLKEGDRVQFDTEQGEKGPKAVNIEFVG